MNFLCACADTTDVQSSTITGSDHQLNVTCFFAEGTQASGCVVRLEGSGGVVYQMVPRVNETAKGVVRTEFSVDCYNISVVDWEEDGSVGSLQGVPVILNTSLNFGGQTCEGTSGEPIVQFHLLRTCEKALFLSAMLICKMLT